VKRGAAQIDEDPEVRRIAKVLGLEGTHLKARLCDAAEKRVARRLDQLGISAERLQDVHDVVLDMTGLRVVRVANDEDLKRLSKEYRSNPAIPVQLELEFGSNTEALVFRDGRADPRTPAFTAVVDARGDRKWRAWFAERHEPAHLLVPDPGGNVLWRRTTMVRPEPVEQVIDAIASRVGFWGPIVVPAIDAALKRTSSVLQAFEEVRRTLAPEASREASYRAFAQLVTFPLAIVRSDYGCRRADVANVAGSWALRALTVIHNDAAERAGIIVRPNFRVPEHSVVHAAHADGVGIVRVQDDDLNAWRTEAGRPLAKASRPITVTTHRRWATLTT
jgi:hypothetical protein